MKKILDPDPMFVKKMKISQVMLRQHTYVQVGSESRSEISLHSTRYDLELKDGFVICKVGKFTTLIPMANIASIWIE
jgi:hypothetical protein